MLSRVCLFAISWTAAHQASLSDTSSQSLLKLMSIELGMSSNHLILCHPLLLLPSIFPSIRAFCNESVLCIRWPKVLELQHQSFKRPPASNLVKDRGFRYHHLLLRSGDGEGNGKRIFSL